MGRSRLVGSGMDSRLVGSGLFDVWANYLDVLHVVLGVLKFVFWNSFRIVGFSHYLYINN